MIKYSSIGAGRCADELVILRESHSMRELISCGRNGSLELEELDETAPRNGEEFDRLQVKFYTSRHCHNCGFLIFVFCVDILNAYNQPGCSQTIPGPSVGKRDAAMVSRLLYSALSAAIHCYCSNPILEYDNALIAELIVPHPAEQCTAALSKAPGEVPVISYHCSSGSANDLPEEHTEDTQRKCAAEAIPWNTGSAGV